MYRSDQGREGVPQEGADKGWLTVNYLDVAKLFDDKPAAIALLSTFQFDPHFFERRLLRCSALAKARRIRDCSMDTEHFLSGAGFNRLHGACAM